MTAVQDIDQAINGIHWAEQLANMPVVISESGAALDTVLLPLTVSPACYEAVFC